jgi:hypothetical protein
MAEMKCGECKGDFTHVYWDGKQWICEECLRREKVVRK